MKHTDIKWNSSGVWKTHHVMETSTALQHTFSAGVTSLENSSGVWKTHHVMETSTALHTYWNTARVYGEYITFNGTQTMSSALHGKLTSAQDVINITSDETLFSIGAWDM